MTNDRHYTDEPIERKVVAEPDEGLVVVHIGLRINAFWKIHRWLPILLLAPRMVLELVSDPWYPKRRVHPLLGLLRGLAGVRTGQ